MQEIPYTDFSAHKRKSGHIFTMFQIYFKPEENLDNVSNINHTNSGQCFKYKCSENLDNVSNKNHTNSGQCFKYKCSENLDNASNKNHTNSGQCFKHNVCATRNDVTIRNDSALKPASPFTGPPEPTLNTNLPHTTLFFFCSLLRPLKFLHHY